MKHVADKLGQLSDAFANCLRLHSEAADPGARRQSLAVLLAGLSTALRSTSPAGAPRGRRRVYDRRFAKAALLDFVTSDPDGMVHQAALIRELEHRLGLAGHPIPGETWLKAVVREFQEEALAFELDAAETFRTSPALQAIFPDLTDFLAFRSSKARARHMWEEDSQLRSLFPSPEKLLEAALHNDFRDGQQQGISAHSRLPQMSEAESNGSNERSA